MSADVQPRKRKDKKKKRDSLDKSEGDIFARKLSLKDDEEVKESHHGVHATKMGAEDVHLHIQAEHATGGNWCAKVFFFSLLAILLGLIGLIIVENRGLSDLDTPLSESRFSEYFEGWVDESRQSHDDHKMPPELEDDHNTEPFEEEEDHSEMEDDDEHVDNESHKDHDDEIDDQEDDEDTTEKAVVEELSNEEEDEQDLDNVEEDKDEEIETNDKDTDLEDDDVDEGFEDGDADDNDVESVDDDDDEEDNNDHFHTTAQARMSEKINEDAYDEIKLSNDHVIKSRPEEFCATDQSVVVCNKIKTTATFPFFNTNKRKNLDDEDDDFDSLEHVVNNDADEDQRLQKAIDEQERAAKLLLEREKEEEEENESSSMSLKVFVGVALAFVARLVLIRNSESSTKIGSDTTKDDPIVSMRRRLTMITAEEPIPVDHDEQIIDDLEEEYLEEEEFEEEEIEYCEEEQIVVEKYVPETFEQMHSMYRSKESEYAKASGIEDLRAKVEDIKPKLADTQPRLQEIKQTIQDIKPKIENIAFPSAEPKQILVEKYPELATKNSESHVKIPTIQSLPSSFIVEQNLNKTETQEQIKDGKEEEINPNDDLGEEEEEEIDEEELGSEEEEVSDVDDDDLMLRLEAKYGKLPQRHYDSEEEEDQEDLDSWTKINPRSAGGPQSYTEDDYIEEELRRANEDMLQNNLQSALKTFESLSKQFPDVPGALYGKAKALDRLSEVYRNNQILNEAIQSYKRFLSLGDLIDDHAFKEAAERCIDRMRFRGLELQAVPIHKMLMSRFSTDPHFSNQLAVTYLLLNRLTEAKKILEDTLNQWPDDGFAQVHYGFVLKNLDKDLKSAVDFLWKGIKSEQNGTQDGRFYFNLGDCLQRLGRLEEAKEVYRAGALKKLFLSEYQRSLYNVENLKAQPIWTKKETTYEKYFNEIERNWKIVRQEGLNALNEKGYFVDEAESLRHFGDWKQLELFSRGYRNKKNCEKAPVTCALIESFPDARFCKRGQTKFSVMHPGTHVWPHCGPTNCRIRAHLGLKIPINTKIRIATEERTWEEGKFLIFDDSFEHEVWHNGTSPRLVLIIDVWHPELTEKQRNDLSPI